MCRSAAAHTSMLTAGVARDAKHSRVCCRPAEIRQVRPIVAGRNGSWQCPRRGENAVFRLPSRWRVGLLGAPDEVPQIFVGVMDLRAGVLLVV